MLQPELGRERGIAVEGQCWTSPQTFVGVYLHESRRMASVEVPVGGGGGGAWSSFAGVPVELWFLVLSGAEVSRLTPSSNTAVFSKIMTLHKILWEINGGIIQLRNSTFWN